LSYPDWSVSGTPAPPLFDSSKPSPARVYNAMLGGKDNYAADREVAEPIMRLSAAARHAARDNRLFLDRAVRWAAVAGVRQFLDIGAGMPMPGRGQNTHEVAQAIRDARVAYTDNDPVAAAHAAALLAMDAGVTAFRGDLRVPAGIWGNPELRDCFDLGEPVAVILGAVLHFLGDADACRAVDYLKDAMAPGSVLIISHATGDDASPGEIEKVQGALRAAGTPIFLRTGDQVERFFDGLALVKPPGVTDVNAWRTDAAPGTAEGVSQVIGYGGAAVKPGREAGPAALAWQGSSGGGGS
jgi:hypothetical protein